MILYREYPPCPNLQAYVDCLWTCSLEDEAHACSHRVLPDNGLDILWQDHQSDGFVVGMMSVAGTAILPPRVRTVAVRFKPGAAAYFFNVPLQELADGRADLADLWGSGWAARITDALWDKPMDDARRLATLEQHLLDFLAAHRSRVVLGYLDHAVAAIEAANGQIKIEALADEMGVSRQHLGAQFRARVGLNAKTFARICRFRKAAEAIKHGSESQNWAVLSLDCGYFDQSHMIHDFQDIAGVTPESFASRHSR